MRPYPITRLAAARAQQHEGSTRLDTLLLVCAALMLAVVTLAVRIVTTL